MRATWVALTLVVAMAAAKLFAETSESAHSSSEYFFPERTKTRLTRRKADAPLAARAFGGSSEENGEKERETKKHQKRHQSVKPNIVLILTDDQDVELGSLNFMPRTMRLVRQAGAEFRHAYTTTPMCCPSRSSLLTGMYVHNHNVYTNNDNCSGPAWQQEHEPRSFATYLSNAGYRTGYFGKYLNKYNGSYVPPGWREWGGLIMNSKYYNYSVNMNGNKIRHGFDYHKDYYPDLIANDSLAFLRHSKQRSSRKPVLLVLSFPAPHGPEDAAPHFTHLFFNVTTHHTPTYDLAPNPDKQWILQVTDKMRPIHKKFTDLLMTKRLQTLQSVDQAVERVHHELEQLGELDNTYIVYTSDHGYHLGQFGLVKGKSFPFEFDVRVPFLVRGPGVEPGTVVDDIVLNVDIAPTFLDMAGVNRPYHMDGQSFLPLLSHKARAVRSDTFLIESSGRRETAEQIAEAKARAALHKYTQKANNFFDLDDKNNTSEEGDDFFSEDDDDDEIEIDDEEEDEESVSDDQLDNELGGGRAARLARACASPSARSPCKPKQSWRCELVNGRWRRHKCKYETEPKNQSKKCACFTPGGVVYTRLETDAPSQNVYNFKRNLFVRSKRDLINTIRNISETIAKYERFKRVKRSPDDDLECRVEWNGKVNCSRAVYEDLKTWQTNRLFLEDQIRRLKIQLEDLKEIRRHLKESRPEDFKNVINETEPATTEKQLSTDSEMSTASPSYEDSTSTVAIDDYTEEDDFVSFDNSTVELSTVGYEEEESPPPIALGPTRLDISLFRESQNNLTKFDLDEERERLPPYYIDNEERHICYCESDRNSNRASVASRPEELAREERRRLKEARIRKRQRKARRKARPVKECLSEKMNCFSHDNDHWRTEPRWSLGPFCFCMNANNNTYSCLRTINSTHNFLYCEFVTGLITYYNLRIDPFETQNREKYLTAAEKSYLHNRLEELKRCKGRSCRSESRAVNNWKTNGRHQLFKENFINSQITPVSAAAAAAISIAAPSALRLVTTENKTVNSRGKIVKPWRKRKWNYDRNKREKMKRRSSNRRH